MFENYKSDKIIVHYIGNKLEDEGVKISNDELETDEALQNLLFYKFVSFNRVL